MEGGVSSACQQTLHCTGSQGGLATANLDMFTSL